MSWLPHEREITCITTDWTSAYFPDAKLLHDLRISAILLRILICFTWTKNDKMTRYNEEKVNKFIFELKRVRIHFSKSWLQINSADACKDNPLMCPCICACFITWDSCSWPVLFPHTGNRPWMLKGKRVHLVVHLAVGEEEMLVKCRGKILPQIEPNSN